MSQDIMLAMVMMVAMCAFVVGSSVSGLLIAYNEGVFGDPQFPYKDQSCREVWLKECEGTRGKARDECITSSKLTCIMGGGTYTPPEELKSTAFPSDCNAGARQACSGKGQKCVDEYKAACIANGGRWTTASGQVLAICGRTDIRQKNGLLCPTNEGCLINPECRAACPCGHTYALTDTDREDCVYLYLHNDGVNDHVEGPLKVCAPATGERTVDLATFRNPNSSISYDEKVSSIRVGKNVGVRLYKKDSSLPLVFPTGGAGHQLLMNLVDYCGTPASTCPTVPSDWNDSVHTLVIGKAISR